MEKKKWQPIRKTAWELQEEGEPITRYGIGSRLGFPYGTGHDYLRSLRDQLLPAGSHLASGACSPIRWRGGRVQRPEKLQKLPQKYKEFWRKEWVFSGSNVQI